MRSTNLGAIGLLVLAFSATCESARAEAGNPLTDSFSLDLGSFFLTSGTNLSVNGHGIAGTPIDAERDLGLRDKDSFRIDAYWRFAARHKLRVMYFNSDRSVDHSITHDIAFNGTTYTAHADVHTRFDVTIAEVAYEYAFVRTDRFELAGSVGIHDLEFKTSLSLAGGPLVATNSQTASANGPLPVVGLDGVWRLTDTLSLSGQAQFFKISISPYDGRLENYALSMVWHPIKNIGIGAGYDYFWTRVGVDSEHFDGSLKWRYGGARVFINASI